MKSLFTSCAFIFLFSQNTFAAALTQASSPSSKPFFDLDISGSSGNYNGTTYTEMHLGLNLNFTDWLTWRNAAFKRFSSTTANDITGLDSSVRLSVANHFDGGGVNFFAGPGYRWTSSSDKNALFGEAGATLSFGRFSVGGGAKYLRYDRTQLDPTTGLETKRDDINYFITVAGGAGLSF